MWPVLLLLAVDDWEEKKPKPNTLQWPVGQGKDICSFGSHTTVAFYLVVTQDGPVYFFSKFIYTAAMATKPDGPDTGPSKGLGPKCMSSREVPLAEQEPTPWAREKPLPHSEIAALQHLFGISSGQTAKLWANAISARLQEKDYLIKGREFREVHVVLCNSAYVPCGGESHVGKTFTNMNNRCCCDLFLQKVVRQLELASVQFSITVMSPGKIKVYGEPIESVRMSTVQRIDVKGNGVGSSSRRRRPHRKQDFESSRDLEAELHHAIWRLLITILADL